MTRLFQSLKKTIRVGNWWYSKIPPLLTIALFLFLPAEDSFGEGVVSICCVFASILCVAAFGHIVNDVFDVEEDRLAGKENAMAKRSGRQQLVACLLPLICGFLPGLFLPYPPWGWVLLTLNYLWPTIYSIPPIRFKERGIVGLLLDAAGSHITPTMFVLVVVSHSLAVVEILGFPRFAVISVWAAVLGIKGILYHQLADWSNDDASDTKTWARSVDREKLSRFLPRYNLFFEVPANITLAISFLPWSPLTGVFLGLYILIETIKYGLGFEFALDANPRNHRRAVPFCNDLFYDCWLLLSVAIHLALLYPKWIWTPFAIIVLFTKSYRILIQDLNAVREQVVQRLKAKQFFQ